MSLSLISSLIVSFCSGYAQGNEEKLLTCSDFVVNCAVKEDITKKEIDLCFLNFKEGKRYEEKNNRSER